MNALLRLQAVVIARTFANPIAILCLAAIGWMLLHGASGPHDGSVRFLGVYGASLFASHGMRQTFLALDAVRWMSPVGPRRVLAAHFVFWIALGAVPAIAVAILTGSDDGGRSPIRVGVLAVWAIATVPTFLTLVRSGTARQWAFYVWGHLVIVVPAITLLVSPHGLVNERLVESIVATACGSAVVIASAVRFCLRDERLPALRLEERAPGRRGANAPQQAHARSPARSLTVGSWGATLLLALLTLILLSGKDVPTPMLAVPALALGVLAHVALVRCRWILATPIDRARAFRILVAPAATWALLVATMAASGPEFRADRTQFDDGHSSFWASTLHQSEHPDDQLARAAQVGLRREFGLTIAYDDIRESIRRGNATYVSDPDGKPRFSMAAWIGAMDCIRRDFTDRIVRADRFRCVAIAAAVLLGTLAVVIVLLSRLRSLRVACALAVVTTAMGHRWEPVRAALIRPARASWMWLLTHLVAAPPWTLALAGIGSITLLVVLWKCAETSFRRLEITDLPASGLLGLVSWRGPRGSLLSKAIDG